MVPHRVARVVTLLLWASLALAPRADPVPAAQVIDRFHATLLDAMKNAKALGVEGRLARIEPVMVETYDFPAMAQRSPTVTFGPITQYGPTDTSAPRSAVGSTSAVR